MEQRVGKKRDFIVACVIGVTVRRASRDGREQFFTDAVEAETHRKPEAGSIGERAQKRNKAAAGCASSMLAMASE